MNSWQEVSTFDLPGADGAGRRLGLCCCVEPCALWFADRNDGRLGWRGGRFALPAGAKDAVEAGQTSAGASAGGWEEPKRSGKRPEDTGEWLASRSSGILAIDGRVLPERGFTPLEP